MCACVYAEGPGGGDEATIATCRASRYITPHIKHKACTHTRIIIHSLIHRPSYEKFDFFCRRVWV